MASRFRSTEMLDEIAGRSERRGTAIALFALFVEALWTILHKYPALDAGLWAMQAELVARHLGGIVGDGWKLIPFPAANTGVPLLTGLLAFFMSGEIAVRLSLALIAILARGGAMIALLRVLRVRDESIYFLVPVLTWSALWFTGSLPYLVAETVALFTIAFFLAQDRPRSFAYWIVSLGLAVTALFHALAFCFASFVIVTVALEQRRSVHLSQGWLTSGKTVMSLLIPGLAILLLAIFPGEPVFTISTSGFLPDRAPSRLFFYLTPVPHILEAAFPAADLLHLAISIAFVLLVTLCLARAFLLAIEESTWHSRAVKSAGVIVFLFALAGVMLGEWGVETAAWIPVAALLLLAASYSRGPSARRTPIDRIILSACFVAMIVCGLANGVALNRGSEAASEVLKRSRMLVSEESASARERGVDSVFVRTVIDSQFAQSVAGGLFGTFSYALTAPIYLYGEHDRLSAPWTFQPRAGIVAKRGENTWSASPAVPLRLGNAEEYVDARLRVLGILPVGTATSPTFGPYAFTLSDTSGEIFSTGGVQFRLAIGRLAPNRPSGLALQQR